MTGSGATANVVTGYETTGTAASNSGAVDASYYSITNGLGLGPAVSIRNMYSSWVQTNAGNTLCNNCDPNAAHPVFYGVTFVNPTNAAITITQVDFTTDVDNFTPTTIQALAPAAGWQPVSQANRRLVRWSGSVTVPSRGSQDFIFNDSPQNNAANNTTRTVTINTAFTTSAGAFTGTPFTFTALTSNSNAAANAGVSFDLTGGAIPVPVISVPNKSSAAPINLAIRVGETGNNGNSSAIATNLQLTITVPRRWSAVSMPTIAAPWSAATLSITQPTATTDGTVTIRTSAAIAAGATTAPNTLILRATAPSSSVSNLFPFPLALSGVSAGGRAISSFNDSLVQVTGSGTEAVNVELLSTALASPVRSIDFTATLNVIDGPGGESVTVAALQPLTNTWDTLATITPGTTNSATTPFTFRADYATHVDASRRMKVRFVSNGNTLRTLRIDQIKWDVTLGYTVSNTTGVDLGNSSGDVAQPFLTLGKAVSLLANSGAAYVEVGSGAPYDVNLSIAGAGHVGTPSCSTLIQGVASGSVLPRIRGTSSNDFGLDIASNYVTVDRLQIENTGAAFVVEPNTTGVVLSNSIVRQMDDGYGIVLNANAPSTILNNTIDAAGSRPLFAVLDESSQSVIDGNKVLGSGSEFGIYSGGNSPVIRRNIVRGAAYGIYLSSTTGVATLYNNTVDQSVVDGLVADHAASVLSRNNISMRGTTGWKSNVAGTVDSDYDDMYNNYFIVSPPGTQVTNNYSGVTAGAHSFSADPLFIDTITSSSANFYRLNTGSPCINTGVNVGLPSIGIPDVGAVESQ